MSDIDRIRERHAPVTAPSISGSHVCAFDTQPWPCDTRVVLDALDSQQDRQRIYAKRYHAQQDAWLNAETAINDAVKRWEAERALADQLAEALRGLQDPQYPQDPCFCLMPDGSHDEPCMVANAAIRAHEEARK